MAIYNEVIRNFSAIYIEREAKWEDRRTWLAQRTGRGYPVLVAEDQINRSVWRYVTFGDFRAWPGYRHTVEHSVYIRTDARGREIGTTLVQPLLVLLQHSASTS